MSNKSYLASTSSQRGLCRLRVHEVTHLLLTQRHLLNSSAMSIPIVYPVYTVLSKSIRITDFHYRPWAGKKSPHYTAFPTSTACGGATWWRRGKVERGCTNLSLSNDFKTISDLLRLLGEVVFTKRDGRTNKILHTPLFAPPPPAWKSTIKYKLKKLCMVMEDRANPCTSDRPVLFEIRRRTWNTISPWPLDMKFVLVYSLTYVCFMPKP